MIIVLGDPSYVEAFSEDFTSTLGVHVEEDIPSTVSGHLLEGATLLVFTGGDDIAPEFYGGDEVPDGIHDYDRDYAERAWFLEAKARGLPCVGICRGAQFLNIMNQGSMIQDMNGHHGSHLAYSYTDPLHKLTVTSDHHQMMVPGPKAEVLLWAHKSSDCWPLPKVGLLPYHPVDEGFGRVDPEVILYRKTKDLCHQPHPEWAEPNSPYWDYFNFTVERLLRL